MQVKDNRGIATTLSILVPLSIVLGIVSALLAPPEVTYEDQTTTVATGGTLGAIGAIVALAAAVVGLVWVFRVASNARAVGDPTTPSPGWALGSWFIPVAHIVLPLFPLYTAWKKSRAGGGLYWAWGIAWAASTTLVYATIVWSFTLGFQEGLAAAQGEEVTVDLPPAFAVVNLVSTGLHAVAGALFLMVVWRFHAAQTKMGEWLARRAATAAY